jgi:hypothetical protein
MDRGFPATSVTQKPLILNHATHWRIVWYVTETPRAASISSTMRRLNGNRKYRQTA